MAGHEPPAEPPSGYVWVDARRLETLEASIDRLTRQGVDFSVFNQATRERFFTSFARLERLEIGMARLLEHFKLPVPK